MKLKTVLVHGVDLIASGDAVVSIFQSTGSFEPLTFAKWLSLAFKGGVVLDIGAYTGLYAIAAAKAGAQVFAFEPNPTVYRRLTDNAALNSVKVDARRIAIWDAHAILPLHVLGGRPLTSASSLVNHFKSPSAEVHAGPIDGFEFSSPVKVMKIDVERAEAQVIEGALRTIKRDSPVILVELLDGVEPVASILRDLDYSYETLDKAMYIFTRRANERLGTRRGS